MKHDLMQVQRVLSYTGPVSSVSESLVTLHKRSDMPPASCLQLWLCAAVFCWYCSTNCKLLTSLMTRARCCYSCAAVLHRDAAMLQQHAFGSQLPSPNGPWACKHCWVGQPAEHCLLNKPVTTNNTKDTTEQRSASCSVKHALNWYLAHITVRLFSPNLHPSPVKLCPIPIQEHAVLFLAEAHDDFLLAGNTG